jgi:hypothetical protein
VCMCVCVCVCVCICVSACVCVYVCMCVCVCIHVYLYFCVYTLQCIATTFCGCSARKLCKKWMNRSNSSKDGSVRLVLSEVPPRRDKRRQSEARVPRCGPRRGTEPPNQR